MDDRYIFHWKELPFDGAYYLAEELYSARGRKNSAWRKSAGPQAFRRFG